MSFRLVRSSHTHPAALFLKHSKEIAVWIIEAYVAIDYEGTDYSFIMANRRKSVVEQEFKKLCDKYDGHFESPDCFIINSRKHYGDEIGFMMYKKFLNTKEDIDKFLGIASKASHDTTN